MVRITYKFTILKKKVYFKFKKINVSKHKNKALKLCYIRWNTLLKKKFKKSNFYILIKCTIIFFNKFVLKYMLLYIRIYFIKSSESFMYVHISIVYVYISNINRTCSYLRNNKLIFRDKRNNYKLKQIILRSLF